jgi:hypothetical protein
MKRYYKAFFTAIFLITQIFLALPSSAQTLGGKPVNIRLGKELQNQMGIEKDGKKYKMIGQRVAIINKKEVGVGIYAGVPFQASTLKVEGELKIPLQIKIVKFENGKFFPDEESQVPLYVSFDRTTGKLESKYLTNAVNVTWIFPKGISFTIDGKQYVTEKDGATIRFKPAWFWGQGSVELDGIK